MHRSLLRLFLLSNIASILLLQSFALQDLHDDNLFNGKESTDISRLSLSGLNSRTDHTSRFVFGGSFQVVGQSGVPAMAAALMPNGNVIFLDKVENYTQVKLKNGQYAYSAEYNLTTNTARPLAYKTNAFCSGGSFLADGRLISVGGNGPLSAIDSTVGDGFRAIRYLRREIRNNDRYGNEWYSSNQETAEKILSSHGYNKRRYSKDWKSFGLLSHAPRWYDDGDDDDNNAYSYRDNDDWSEPGHVLSTARWYASVQILPNRTLFVASGSLNGLDPMNDGNNNPTFEILDTNGRPISQSVRLPILERNQPYYMYPFLHLLKDGRLFIFVSRSAEIYDVSKQRTTRQLPDLQGAHRTYPNTGGSVLLPLLKENNWEPDIIVCGGGAYADISSPTDRTCGRIQPLSADPVWQIEKMPEGRVMVEGTLLPDGKVLWLNGARRGAQGFGIAKEPCLNAMLYDPEKPRAHRWIIAGSSRIPRLYHSVALLLLDGTVMVAGSNPVEQPILKSDFTSAATSYITEFRVEIYTPPYLGGINSLKRPRDIWISQKRLAADGRSFIVAFTSSAHAKKLKIALYHGGFVTHSLHMGQRLVFLQFDHFVPGFTYQIISVSMPSSHSIVPPGPYVIYVVLDGVPGMGQFVMVG